MRRRALVASWVAGWVAVLLGCDPCGAQECPGGFAATPYGAVGYGAGTRGGDPSDIVYVTSVDSLGGAGTLRALLVPANNGKTIGFDIGATDTIVVANAAHIEPVGVFNITIDGAVNTSGFMPVITGPGIVGNPIMEWKGDEDTSGGGQSHNVIISNIHFGNWGDDGAIRFEEIFYNAIITGCTFFGTGDEEAVSVVADAVSAHHVTVQYSIFHNVAPGLKSLHISGAGTTVTAWRNLFTGKDRSPNVQLGIAQVINNVCYDWGGQATHFDALGGLASYGDAINNYYLATGSTSAPDDAIQIDPPSVVHTSGNVFRGGSSGDPPTAGGVRQAAPTVPTVTALEALAEVLAYAGCPETTAPNADGSMNRTGIDSVLVATVTAAVPSGDLP